ncbi:uncharacterized protein [Eurosta solidaginis]|uniref:uncharacterized protein n=1 Tax=Eurosta solidaginis TaxID=178769 RepID=UPI0035305762
MNRTIELKRIISEYMKERDIPAWYRGISPFQMKAVDQLLNAIRDDIEQNTTHRVRQCLLHLGLVPTVGCKDVQTLMKLCGGNDLAFLWFLMELYYKTKGDKYDSLNEQLILSSICHLDMITTLRELDRILPPGHASKRQIELRQRQQIRERSWKEPHKLVKKRSSPYFEKLAKPRKFGKPLTLERPDFKVRFPRYDAYKDPTYVPPNEKTRWYAHHIFRGSERVTKTTLRDCIAEIMKMIDLSPTNYGDTHDYTESIINQALNFESNKDYVNILCEHHRLENEERDSRLMKFFIRQRENCLKHLELFAGQKQANLQKIRDMLDKEVEMYRLHYRKMNTPHDDGRSYIRILGKKEYTEHYIKDDMDEQCHPNAKCDPTPVSLKNCSQVMGSGIIPKRHRLSFDQANNINNFDLSYFNTATPPSSQHFFIRPTEHKPYHFDFAKIFNYKTSASDRKKFIKNKCVEAMDKEPRTVPKTVDLTPDLRKVAKNCANEMWNENENKWRAEEEARSTEELVNQIDSYPKDMPRLPFYDCEDKDLMDLMLKIALNEMSKQPKFVLASLPDAYKIPMLRDWITQRYGKRYTHAEQLQALNTSIRIMNMLQELKLRIKLPTPCSIGKNFNQTYDCHNHIMKKVNQQRRYFYQRLNAELLKRARYFWFAMRSSLALLPLNKTFFAYFPARPGDNYLFKPWKISEFMDAKAIYEKRRLKNSQKIIASQSTDWLGINNHTIDYRQSHEKKEE